jgi:1-acyl-sn-glycerol-3-phosphate acyltransferase
MVPIRVIAYTLYTYIVIGLLSVFFIIPAIIIFCLPEKSRYNSRFVYWIVYFFYKATQLFSLLPITYTGLENIPDEPVIFAANHQSSLDIPLVGLLAKGAPHVWLARSDILQDFWFVAFLIRRTTVLVDVSTPRQGMLSLLRISNLVKDKECHVMIFPEGGRFATGVVNHFHGGFVLLAKRLNRPIIPVYIKGVYTAYPPNSWWARWGKIEVIVGKPFVLHADETDEDFKHRVHQWFVDQVR